MQQRRELMQVALGAERADVLLRNGQVVNVYSGEVLPGMEVALKGNRIAYVGEARPGAEARRSVDLQGRFLIPGLIDAHTHLDSLLGVPAFAAYAVAFGNTTAVSETGMMANAGGLQAVKDFLKSAAGLPLRVFFLAPPMVPPFPGLETSYPFAPSDFEELLAREDCLGVGETYWPRVLSAEERSLRQYSLAARYGKRREGHAAGARRQKLQAYVAAGTSSCHEAIRGEEALERLRLGLAVMIREGAVRRELDAVSAVFGAGVDLDQVMIVSDGADIEEFLQGRGMNSLLSKAVRLGCPAVKAVQMTTLNAARYFGLQDLGAIAPGKLADLVVVDDLVDFNCYAVWSSGVEVARRGRLLVEIPRREFPAAAMESIDKRLIDAGALRMAAYGEAAEMRVVEIINETITRERVMTVKAQGGCWQAAPADDLLKVVVFNRRALQQPPFLGFVRGLGLRQGAVASTLSWDTTNLLCVGASDRAMLRALNRVVELGGGVVAASEERVTAELPLPIYGVVSRQPLPEVASRIRDLENACRHKGWGNKRPLLALQTLPFTGLPGLRPTDRGLLDVRRGVQVELLVEGSQSLPNE